MAGVIRGAALARLLDVWTAAPGPGGTRLPEYAALAATVRGLLRDGRLGLGVRVPAERELSTALAVSRTTVTSAYRELRTTGHLTSRRGAGSWTSLPEGQRIGTSGQWAPADEPDMLDLGTAALPAPPELIEAAAAALADLAPYARGAGYHPAGLGPLREAVAERFTRRGLPTRADQVMITNGVQHGVDLVLRLGLAPGQTALTEQPTYPNVLTALRAHRARLAVQNVDRVSGWDGDALLAAIRSVRPALAYVIPEFQNPTGHLMPTGLRERLAAVAHTAGTDLLVDESFVDLPLDPAVSARPPLAVFDRHARVLTVGGMTKPFWGGLRVGWIRAAAPVIARLSALRVAVDMAGPVLDQLVALRLLERADDVLTARRARLSTQRDTLVRQLRAELPEWSCTVPAGGTCLWVELDAPVSTALAQAAQAHGLRLAPGPTFGTERAMERFVRLPYALPAADLTDAVARLVKARDDLDRYRPADWSGAPLVA